jgi:transposase-like protein
MASVLKQPYFHDEQAAFAALEAIMWPNGQPPACPHCGVTDRMNRLAVQTSKPSKKNPEGKPVHGLWKCYACRQQFTVRKGTIFEESRLELHLWFQAAFLMCSSKKGVSANQLHRTLGVTLKTAWFLAHRLREAMREGDLAVPFGSGGGMVEVDETFIGNQKGKPKKRAYHHKMKVLTLVDRETRQAKSMVVDNIHPKTIAPILRQNMAREACLMTDEGGHYMRIGREFADHQVVRHGQEEYVRGEAHTNTIEGYATSGGSKLKTPDAIHLASAILHRADEFHTFDETLIALSGNVAGHKLTICKPIAKNPELDLNPPKKP